MAAPIDDAGLGPAFWVSVVSATATWIAIVVALFAQHFRAKFFPPQLSLRLNDRDGVPVAAQLTDPDGSTRMEGGRYYHVCVSNSRRWSTARSVQVVLLGVEEAGADGTLREVWRGDGVPLQWQHQSVNPVSRAIGPAANVDLCSVIRGKWVELHPLIFPFNLKVRYTEACDFVVTVQAKGEEADSLPLRVRIAWDGSWHDGAGEMRHHMSVSELH